MPRPPTGVVRWKGDKALRLNRTIALAAVLLPGLALAAERPKLAVMDLAAKSGIEQAQLDVLGDMLATEIRVIGLHEVVTKSDIQSMLGLERSKELRACDDASCMAEIGGALGVELMVSGNVGRFGKVYAVNLKLINVKQAKVDNSVFRKVEGGEQALLDDFPIAVRQLLRVGGAQAPSPSQTTRPRPAPQPSTSAYAAGPSGAPGLLELGFTQQQIQRILSAGVQITADAPEVARRLLAREFTTEDITELMAAQRLLDNAPKDGELFGLYYLAGLEPKKFKAFLKSRPSLTEYYNSETEGMGLEIGKWVCFGLGALFAITGGLYYGLATMEEDTYGTSDYYTDTADTYWIIGHSMMGLAAPLVLVSIVLMIVDAANAGYLPQDFFRDAKKGDVEKQLGRSARRISLFGDGGPALELMASPYVDRDGRGGLLLGVRF